MGEKMNELKELYSKLGELQFNAEIIASQISEVKRKIVEVMNNSKNKEVKPNANIS